MMNFKNELAPFAQAQGRLHNILPAFIMAVAWLETGGGTSSLCTKANNLFSIKGEFNGDSITLPTSEYLHGKWVKVNAKFRKYPNFEGSVIDFCELIKNGVSWDRNKYNKAVIGVHDLDQVCYNFGRTGYMTDPAYSGKLLAVIKSEHLAVYNALPQQPHPAEIHPAHVSLVDYLKSEGKDSSFAARAIFAKRFKMKGYQGTAAQNNLLLQHLKEGK
jgi:flagellum-specific peptidoglycan hydrolase FlgJ